MSASSKKKIAANRINGQKSHGPTNTTTTRFNATKHSLLATGITELDDAEGYRGLLNSLREEKAPVGTVENLLIDSIALDIVRLRRARRLEAEYITGELNPPTIQRNEFDFEAVFSEPTVLDPGLPAAIGFESGQRLVSVFQRYESTFVIRLLRLLHELERLQRMRSGERLPAPAVVDVSLHSETELADSVHADAVIVESVSAVNGGADTGPAALEEPKVLLGDG